MQLVSKESLDDGRVRIVIHADAEELARALDSVYRDFARRASIPGFRKGKAPRALLEQHLGPEQAQRMALEDLAPDALAQGLREAEIVPYVSPELEKAEAGDGGATFVAVVMPRPQVELGEYRGIAAVRPAVEVTEEQLEAELNRLRERYARYEAVSDRAAQAGDLALVDYDLVVDGEVVEGQSTNGYPCQIGSDSLFPELNEKLPGLKPGARVRIPARVPEGRVLAALAGKPGEYVITLRELKQRVVPELTDEMAREAHKVNSVEELREAWRAVLEHVARQEAEDRLRSEILDEVVQGSRISLPQALLRAEAQARLEQLEQDLRASGRRLEDYLEQRKIDVERWLRDAEMQARGDLERTLALEEIARREGIEVSRDEISSQIEAIARRAGASPERVRRNLQEPGIGRLAERVQYSKVLQFLVDNADVTNEQTAAPEPAESREEQP